MRLLAWEIMKFRVACAALSICTGAAIAAWPSPAQACSCIKAPPPRDAADAASVVFEGTVTGMTEEPGGAGGFAYRLFTLDVERTWKGDEAEQLTIRTMNNSAACGREYEIGETYLVYAREIEGRLSDNLCSRTRRIADASEDLAALGSPPGTPDPPPTPAEPEPPRIEPTKFESAGQAEEQPPAPTPTGRGCAIDHGHSPSSLLLVLPAWAWARRRKRG